MCITFSTNCSAIHKFLRARILARHSVAWRVYIHIYNIYMSVICSLFILFLILFLCVYLSANTVRTACISWKQLICTYEPLQF